MTAHPTVLPPMPYPWDVPGRLPGVDVSAANRLTAAQWRALRAAGNVFASIKAGEAVTPDPRTLRHVADADGVGLVEQAYWFLHSTGNGQAQAEAMARVLDRCPPLAMRECLDWEDGHRVDPHQGGAGAAVALRTALTFLRTIRRLRDRAPVVYTGDGFMQLLIPVLTDPAYAVDVAELAAHDLWVAHYRWDPATGHDYHVATPRIPKPWTHAYAWQPRGNRGPDMPGVPVPLDRDVFFGDRAAFDRFNRNDAADPPTAGLSPVTAWQIALTALGFPVGPIDGVVGPRTVAAIRGFQTRHGLVADGVIGPKTQAAIDAALAAFAKANP